MPAADAGSAGAYRLVGFARVYIYRRPEDLGTMEAVLGDARIVKYPRRWMRGGACWL